MIAINQRQISTRLPSGPSVGASSNTEGAASESHYTWGSEREKAIGWDLVGIGTAGLTVLRGAAFLTPGLGQIVLAASVIQLVVTSQKLLLDLTLSDSDQAKVNAAWPLIEPGGRAAGAAGAMLGSNQMQIYAAAKYGQLAFDLAFGFKMFNETRSLPDVVIPLLKGVDEAFDRVERFMLPENEATTSYSDTREYYDSPADITSTIDIRDIIDATNDPTPGAESIGDSDAELDIDDDMDFSEDHKDHGGSKENW